MGPSGHSYHLFFREGTFLDNLDPRIVSRTSSMAALKKFLEKLIKYQKNYSPPIPNL